MMFMALLTKELRLRLRSERAIWVLVVYVVLLGGIGLIALANSMATINPYVNPISTVGRTIYDLLSIIQFFLIIFITPAFTATAINGEKERQTYDLLLSSRLSGFALAGGKLLAGLMNVFLLIAATVPLFSLAFFFGGIAPEQLLAMLVIFCVSVCLVGAVGLFLSTVLSRPALSMAIAYVFCLLWLALPILGSVLLVRQYSALNDMMVAMANIHPVVALVTVTPGIPWRPSGWLSLPPWIVFACINMLVALFIFWLTTRLARPKSFKVRKEARQLTVVGSR